MIQVPIDEALRYLGITRQVTPEIRARAEEVARRAQQAAMPKWVYKVCSCCFTPDGVYLPEAGFTLSGQMARKMLQGCSRAVLMACTLGAPFDALVRREQARDITDAAILDACGSALIEAVCDEAQAEISAAFPNLFCTDRFSPGYGDLPLQLQPDFSSALDMPRRIGVTLSTSLLMNPCKSVTAVIGLSDTPQPARIRGCAFCSLNQNCQFKKRGQTCGS